MTRLYFTTLLVVLASAVPAWNQVIRGTVISADSQTPVDGASVIVDDSVRMVVSDDEGRFVIEGLKPGRHILTLRKLGFEPSYEEVLLKSAHDIRLTIQLNPGFVDLPEVTVRSAVLRPEALNRITPEETRLYPGTFFDPARFALSFPAVAITNDQANQLIIDGLSPDLMQWHIEGLEVVNPNHLANAGTLSDRPTTTGGGVNMLSNQVLTNSTLLTGTMTDNGNATSGVMDMYFRDGNDEQYQHTVQVGLLGMEAATEGPFKKGGRSSYLVNARYSTVGLLGALGVDFGDEMIQFGDIAFNTNFYMGDRGARIKVYGVLGFNSNDFEAKEPDEWEEDKDRRNINYDSRTEIVGATYSQPLNSNNLIQIRAAYSANTYDRSEQIEGTDFSRDEGGETKISADARLNSQLGRKLSLTAGVTYLYNSIDFERAGNDGEFDSDAELNDGTMIRPYLSARTSLGSVEIVLGTGLAYFNTSEAWNIEPNARVTWALNERNTISAGYRLSSQFLPRLAFVDTTGFSGRNNALPPVRAHNLNLKYATAVGDGVLEIEGRYIELFDVPVAAARGDFSALNLNPYPNNYELDSRGMGSSFSVTAGYRKNFKRSWWATGNVGLISAEYTGSDQVERSTTFDLGYVAFASGGKEWSKDKSYGQRTWGLNASVVMNGGLREGVVDPALSQAALRTEYLPGTQGQVQLGDYFRSDLRLYWRKDRGKRTTTISLDVQNLIGIENPWFSTYDQLFMEVRPGNQLGIIPVLNWRLDF